METKTEFVVGDKVKLNKSYTGTDEWEKDYSPYIVITKVEPGAIYCDKWPGTGLATGCFELYVEQYTAERLLKQLDSLEKSFKKKGYGKQV